MSENLFDLYSQKILSLATEIPLTEPIASAQGIAKKRSPQCGSEVEVALSLRGGRIVDFSQNIRACALGQCSAAIFGKVVIGRDEGELHQLQAEMIAFLKEKAAHPSPPFENYQILTPAQDYPNRHKSIMLVIEASLEAIAEAKKGPQ